MQNDEPGALNFILHDQFKSRIRKLMRDSEDLKGLLDILGEGGLHIAIDEGNVKRARVELQGRDVSKLIQRIFNGDPGLSWLVQRLGKGSLTIRRDEQGWDEYRFDLRLKCDRAGYVK